MKRPGTGHTRTARLDDTPRYEGSRSELVDGGGGMSWDDNGRL